MLCALVTGIVILSSVAVPAHSEALSPWGSATAYPASTHSESCVSVSIPGRGVAPLLVCVGGSGNVQYTSQTNAVYYYSSVGAWVPTTNYPTVITNPDCVFDSGYIYCIGGYSDLQQGATNLAYFAQVSSNGVGAWTATTKYPTTSIRQQSCVTNSGYIYCVGGEYSGTNDAVYYASISSKGIGNWTSTTKYPTFIEVHSCSASSGYVYCVGGYNLTGFTSKVYYASISSNGVGVWTATTSYQKNVGWQSCVINAGYIYCVGGDTGVDKSGNPTYTNAVYYAPLSTSGVGAWTLAEGYPTSIIQHSCVIASGYIYCVGGTSPTISNTAAVYYSEVIPSPTTATVTMTSTATATTTSTITATVTQSLSGATVTATAAKGGSNVTLTSTVTTTQATGTDSLSLGIPIGVGVAIAGAAMAFALFRRRS